MENQRTTPVTLDRLSKKHMIISVVVSMVFLALCIMSGLLSGPMEVQQIPATAENYDILHMDCNADYNNKAVEPPVPMCWRQTFGIYKRWTQYFGLRVQFTRAADVDTEVKKTIHINVLWMGREDRTVEDFTVIANETVPRTVVYDEDSNLSNEVIIFETNSVDDQEYYFQISLLPEEFQGKQDLISRATFKLNYRKALFAMFELGFRVCFVVLTIIIAIVYWRQTARVEALTSIRKEGLTWIKALLIFLVFFNDPLFAFNFIAPSAFLGIISFMFQITFIVILLIFWLVEFGFLASKEDNINLRRFYMPRLVVMGLYWLIAVGSYSALIVRRNSDPLYDWTEDRSLLTFVQVLGGILGGLYFLYLFVLFVRSSAALKRSPSSNQFLFGVHTFVIICTIVGLVFGSLYHYDANHALDLIFFNALFNMYIYLLAYMYTPVPGGYHEAGDGSMPELAHADTSDENDVETGVGGAPGSDPSRFGVGTLSDDDEEIEIELTPARPAAPPRRENQEALSDSSDEQK